MIRSLRPEEFHEEQIAHFIALAEAAQEAAERATDLALKVTYARLASQWVELAQMARRTADRSRPIIAPAVPTILASGSPAAGPAAPKAR